jgi:hypothetical protein
VDGDSMGHVDFDTAWERFARGQTLQDVSPELAPLLRGAYEEIARQPTDAPALKESLHALLAFLASPAGRTDANCRTTDLFFCLSEDLDWDHLADEFADILGDMAGALHDTVSSPDIARNFDSTPEQLLDRLSRVVASRDAV